MSQGFAHRRAFGLAHRFSVPAAWALSLASLVASGCAGSSGSSRPGVPPLHPTSTPNAFFGFTPSFTGDVADIRIPTSDPSHLYAAEISSGRIRVLGLDQSPLTETASYTLSGIAGDFLSKLVFDDATRTLAVTAAPLGHGGEVVLFDLQQQATTDRVDLPSILVATTTQVTALADSDGCTTSTFSPNLPNEMVFLGDALFVATSNVKGATARKNDRGTVLRLPLDPSHHTFATHTPDVAFTIHYNPVALRAYRTAGGKDVLLCLLSGAPEQGFGCSFPRPRTGRMGALEVIDPQTLVVEAVFEVGTASLPKSLAVLPGRGEAYLGLGDDAFGQSEIYRVDLAGIDAALASPGADDLSRWVRNGVANPIHIPFFDPAHVPTGRFVSALAPTADERHLLAVNFNDATLNVFALGQDVIFESQLRFARGEDLSLTFGPNAQQVVVRPGRGGVDFQGPDVFVGTINIFNPSLQPLPGVSSAIDAVTTY